MNQWEQAILELRTFIGAVNVDSDKFQNNVENLKNILYKLVIVIELKNEKLWKKETISINDETTIKEAQTMADNLYDRIRCYIEHN